MAVGFLEGYHPACRIWQSVKRCHRHTCRTGERRLAKPQRVPVSPTATGWALSIHVNLADVGVHESWNEDKANHERKLNLENSSKAQGVSGVYGTYKALSRHEVRSEKGAYAGEQPCSPALSGIARADASESSLPLSRDRHLACVEVSSLGRPTLEVGVLRDD